MSRVESERTREKGLYFLFAAFSASAFLFVIKGEGSIFYAVVGKIKGAHMFKVPGT